MLAILASVAILCPPPGAPPKSPAPVTEKAVALLDKLQVANTAVDDVLRFPQVRSPGWFPANAGGAHDGDWVFFDPKTNTQYECGYAGTTMQFMVFPPRPHFVRPGLPYATPSWKWSTGKGIAIGANVNDVTHAYGPATLQPWQHPFSALAYRHTAGSRTVETLFIFRDGKLAGVLRQASI